jgi:hypothetical protein
MRSLKNRTPVTVKTTPFWWFTCRSSDWCGRQRHLGGLQRLAILRQLTVTSLGVAAGSVVWRSAFGRLVGTRLTVDRRLIVGHLAGGTRQRYHEPQYRPASRLCTRSSAPLSSPG